MITASLGSLSDLADAIESAATSSCQTCGSLELWTFETAGVTTTMLYTGRSDGVVCLSVKSSKE